MPAGRYHLVLDAIVVHPVDVTFDLIWRRGTVDTALAEWTTHFDPLQDGSFDAQPCERDVDGTAIDVLEGQLVFRYGASASSAQDSYIPNGDGVRLNGRIPNITLPR